MTVKVTGSCREHRTQDGLQEGIKALGIDSGGEGGVCGRVRQNEQCILFSGVAWGLLFVEGLCDLFQL